MPDRRVAVVTGGARGIGARAGLLLAQTGWSVVLVDGCASVEGVPYAMATREDLDAAVEACRGAGAEALGAIADVRDKEALSAAVAEASERFGRLDAAVAAAGAIAGGEGGWSTSEEVWRAMLEVNLGGVRHLAEAAVPRLLAAPPPRTGRFVAVASAAGGLGLGGLAAYCAAKHAVVGYVRALAADLSDSGVTANAVSPGSTRTAMLEASARLYDLDAVEDLAIHQPLGRVLEPEEPAAAVAWLCSPQSGGMTGSIVAVDGGMSAVR